MNSFDFPIPKDILERHTVNGKRSTLSVIRYPFTLYKIMVKIIICYILVLIIATGGIRFALLMLGPIFTKYKTAPYVPSFNCHLNLIKNGLKLKKGTKLVDLGCGDGKALRFFAKNFGLQCEGYDLNAIALRYGKIINRRKGVKNMKLIKGNFEKAELKKYDYVYTYLFPNQLADIEKRVFSSISDKTIIISNSFQFAKHTPFQTIKNDKGKDSIFLYKKNQ